MCGTCLYFVASTAHLSYLHCIYAIRMVCYTAAVLKKYTNVSVRGGGLCAFVGKTSGLCVSMCRFVSLVCGFVVYETEEVCAVVVEMLNLILVTKLHSYSFKD